MRRCMNKSVLLLTAVLVISSSAHALIYDIYYDLESFTAAAQNLSLYDFESDPLGTNYETHDFGDFAVDGSTLYRVSIVNENTHELLFDTSKYYQDMHVTFHEPLKAFGCNWHNIDNNDDMVRVTFDGTTYVLGAKDESGFWGVVVTEGEITSDTPFLFGDTPGGSGWTKGKLDNFRYSFFEPATVSGIVLDTVTAEPLEGVEVAYWSDMHELWQNDITDADGEFTLSGLKSGLAEIDARPHVSSGYACSLPYAINFVSLEEGEHRTDQIISLQKGALVSGYVKDSTGQPLADVEVEWAGKMCGGWAATDASGYFEIRLPIGEHKIAVYGNDVDTGSIGASLTITDVNQPIDVNDIIIYTEQTGSTISGSVVNSGSYSMAGFFAIVAFEAGTEITPDKLYMITPVSETSLMQAGNYTIAALPPDCNYDVHLLIFGETADGIMDDLMEKITIRDSQLNVSPGATAIDLYYTSVGGTVTGTVENVDGNPVLGAYVAVTDFSSGEVAGFTNTDENGNYFIYNVPAGQYAVTAAHSMYQNTSTAMFEVTDGAALDVSTITLPFAGNKEAGNLNGDGIINMLDFVELTQSWMQSGSLKADFDQTGTVEIGDLHRLTETWLYRPIWYNR